MQFTANGNTASRAQGFGASPFSPCVRPASLLMPSCSSQPPEELHGACPSRRHICTAARSPSFLPTISVARARPGRGRWRRRRSLAGRLPASGASGGAGVHTPNRVHPGDPLRAHPPAAAAPTAPAAPAAPAARAVVGRRVRHPAHTLAAPGVRIRLRSLLRSQGLEEGRDQANKPPEELREDAQPPRRPPLNHGACPRRVRCALPSQPQAPPPPGRGGRASASATPNPGCFRVATPEGRAPRGFGGRLPPPPAVSPPPPPPPNRRAPCSPFRAW